MRTYLLKHYTRLRKLIREHIAAGLSPHKMALAVALATLWGTMPMLGLVTVLSIGSSWLFRISIPLVLGMTILITPIQALLVLPFQQLGAKWFPAMPVAKTSQASLLPWMETLGVWQLQALEAWILVMLPVCGLLYLMLWAWMKYRSIRKVHPDSIDSSL